MNISEKSILGKILDALRIDCVVEQGAVGANSSFRKWNSGRAEFWYHINSSGGATTSVWTAPIYYADYPSWSNVWAGVFSESPNQVIVTSNNSQFISIFPYLWTINGISNMRFISVGAKSNVAYAFSVYAIGRWK